MIRVNDLVAVAVEVTICYPSFLTKVQEEKEEEDNDGELQESTFTRTTVVMRS